MKKTLAAVGLILAGVALAVAVMPLFGVSFDWFIPSEPETQIYEIDAPFTALDVQAEGCDVFLYRDRGSEAEVYMPENSRIDASAEVVDGVLTVRWSRRSSWVDRLRDDDYISLSVYLPSNSCDMFPAGSARTAFPSPRTAGPYPSGTFRTATSASPQAAGTYLFPTAPPPTRP